MSRLRFAGVGAGYLSQFHRSGSRTLGEMWPEISADVRRLDGAARLWWKVHDSMKLLGAAYAKIS